MATRTLKGNEMIGAELAERARLFHEHLDSLRDEDGLVYSCIKADEMRPWTNEDLRGYEIWSSWAHDPAGCIRYEDSIMGTGRTVSAKVLRHLATGGDEKALADAEVCVRAILALSREGDKIEDGFLPKPFGGLRKASLSKNTSNDQYEQALFALWTFRQARPDSPLIPDIESAILRWTDYFVRRGFRYLFHGYHWVSLEPVEDADLPVSIARHVLGLYMPMCVMSGKITGDAKYEALLHEKLLPRLKDWIAGPLRHFSGHSNSCNLLGMGTYFCWKNGVVRDAAEQALGLCCKIAESRLSRHDGLEWDYAHLGVSDENQIEPHYMDRSVQHHRDQFGLWVSNAKGASSTVTAHLGALYQRVRPDEQLRATILRILNHFRTPHDFLRLVDVDGRQLPPEHKWKGNNMVSAFEAAWLQAYYLMKLPTEIDGM